MGQHSGEETATSRFPPKHEGFIAHEGSRSRRSQQHHSPRDRQHTHSTPLFACGDQLVIFSQRCDHSHGITIANHAARLHDNTLAVGQRTLSKRHVITARIRYSDIDASCAKFHSEKTGPFINYEHIGHRTIPIHSGLRNALEVRHVLDRRWPRTLRQNIDDTNSGDDARESSATRKDPDEVHERNKCSFLIWFHFPSSPLVVAAMP